MEKKKILAGIAIAAVVLSITTVIFVKNTKTDMQSVDNNQEISKQTDTVESLKAADKNNKAEGNENNISKEQNVVNENSALSKENYKKTNLYNNVPSSMMPLSAIVEVSDQPEQVKSALSKILENSNGVYMVKNIGNKILVVTENPNNIRHGVDFVEIDTKSGHQVTSKLGYSDKMKDSDNDFWEYENAETQQFPIKHIKYNTSGDAEFIETWNYQASDPVKYEMKDADGNIISIKKETLDSNNNLRVENLVYDKNGKTKINLSISYEGDELKRFTYYNADKPSESASVFAEYSDGVKTKETLYTSDLKVKNVYKPAYKEGRRENIQVYNSDNKLIETIYSE